MICMKVEGFVVSRLFFISSVVSFYARRFSSRRFFGTSDTVRVPEAWHYGILFTRGIYFRSTRHGAYYYSRLVPSPIRILGKVRTTITATREKVDFHCRLIFTYERMLIK